MSSIEGLGVRGPVRSAVRGPGPGQELVDPVDRMIVSDASEDVSEIRLWVDAVQLAGLDQRGVDCPVLGAAIGSCEERILAIEGDRADGALDDVGIDLDPAVIEEADKAVPAAEAIADRSTSAFVSLRSMPTG